MDTVNIILPKDLNLLLSLKAGTQVLLSGDIFTARDAVHKLLKESILKGENLPIDLSVSPIYYCGPTPTRSGEIIGSCGPTTSSRMDSVTPLLLDNGHKVMIGKGKRSDNVINSIKKNKAIYLIAVGGAGALIKNYITACNLIAYEELGCEAIHKLTVKNLPLLVGIDTNGNTILN